MVATNHGLSVGPKIVSVVAVISVFNLEYVT